MREDGAWVLVLESVDGFAVLLLVAGGWDCDMECNGNTIMGWVGW